MGDDSGNGDYDNVIECSGGRQMLGNGQWAAGGKHRHLDRAEATGNGNKTTINKNNDHSKDNGKGCGCWETSCSNLATPTRRRRRFFPTSLDKNVCPFGGKLVPEQKLENIMSGTKFDRN